MVFLHKMNKKGGAGLGIAAVIGGIIGLLIGRLQEPPLDLSSPVTIFTILWIIGGVVGIIVGLATEEAINK